MTVVVEVYVEAEPVALVRVDNTDDRELAFELALEAVRDNVGGEFLDVDPDTTHPSHVVDANDSTITDQTMLAAAVQAGQAYKERLTAADRLAGVNDRVTGMLIFDDLEAAELLSALQQLDPSAPFDTPIAVALIGQLTDWLDGVQEVAAA